MASEAVAALAASHGGEKPLSFAPLDALSKLVLLMVKFVPAEGANPAEGAKAKAQAQLLQPNPKPEPEPEPGTRTRARARAGARTRA